ncbi:MAG TPA: orotidine-5'-phosphate decarboxylase [Terriglobales bacterium]|nr:orotidine-5'-phosphate decarboxylase [Terriglobales bacterium]
MKLAEPAIPARNFSALTAAERLIVALDFPAAPEARRAVSAIGETAGWFKVGKQLFTAEGPAFVRELEQAGHNIFLDLKYHDIPATVAGAVKAAAALGVGMITVHASGGSQMLKAAVRAAQEAEAPPLVVAVTVLTSHTEAELQEIGMAGRILDQALRLAALARSAGCDGVVASAKEAAEIRRELGTGFAIVTPGVRPAGARHDDQARVVTPADAIAAGATHIVVGRPITGAGNPRAAAQAILDEIAAAPAPQAS